MWKSLIGDRVERGRFRGEKGRGETWQEGEKLLPYIKQVKE